MGASKHDWASQNSEPSLRPFSLSMFTLGFHMRPSFCIVSLSLSLSLSGLPGSICTEPAFGQWILRAAPSTYCPCPVLICTDLYRGTGTCKKPYQCPQSCSQTMTCDITQQVSRASGVLMAPKASRKNMWQSWNNGRDIALHGAMKIWTDWWKTGAMSPLRKSELVREGG